MLEFIAQCAVIVVSIGAVYVNRDLIAQWADIGELVTPDPRGAVVYLYGDKARRWTPDVVKSEIAALQAVATKRNTVLWRILNAHGVAP